MAEPYLSEIRLFSFGFPPKGWAQCNGQLLPINQNQALFALLGTTYGGDGRVNFALPDLRGRVPISFSGSHTLGERGGEQVHTLSIAELPEHQHVLNVSSLPASSDAPAENYMAVTRGEERYTRGGATHSLDAGSVVNAGGSQAHLNMQPFLTINFCIALQGIFPSWS